MHSQTEFLHLILIIYPYLGGDLVAKLCMTLVTPWTVACQAPLSVGFSWQEDWSGFSFPSPGDLPDPGIKPASLASPSLAGGFFTTEPSEKSSDLLLLAY